MKQFFTEDGSSIRLEDFDSEEFEKWIYEKGIDKNRITMHDIVAFLDEKQNNEKIYF
jgi:hypothetical protein